MAKAPKFQRARIVQIVTREIRRCMRVDDYEIVDSILSDAFGWISNHAGRTYGEIARVALAVAPLATRGALEHAADSLVSGREKSKGASREASDETARRTLKPLGVRYAACGCLAVYASDQCCDRGVQAASERELANETRKTSILKALADRPELLDRWLHDGERLVTASLAKHKAAQEAAVQSSAPCSRRCSDTHR